MARTPSPAAAHVGSNIALLRRQRGLSQDGEPVAVSVPQGDYRTLAAMLPPPKQQRRRRVRHNGGDGL